MRAILTCSVALLSVLAALGEAAAAGTGQVIERAQFVAPGPALPTRRRSPPQAIRPEPAGSAKPDAKADGAVAFNPAAALGAVRAVLAARATWASDSRISRRSTDITTSAHTTIPMCETIRRWSSRGVKIRRIRTRIGFSRACTKRPRPPAKRRPHRRRSDSELPLARFSCRPGKKRPSVLPRVLVLIAAACASPSNEQSQPGGGDCKRQERDRAPDARVVAPRDRQAQPRRLVDDDNVCDAADNQQIPRRGGLPGRLQPGCGGSRMKSSRARIAPSINNRRSWNTASASRQLPACRPNNSSLWTCSNARSM